MKANSLYLVYGLIIATLGVLGFVLTHAKSALISGLASAVIIVALSFFTSNKIGAIVAKVVNVILLGVFSWRATLALTALAAGNSAKLIPGILLAAMALVSLIVLIVSFIKSNRS